MSPTAKLFTICGEIGFWALLAKVIRIVFTELATARPAFIAVVKTCLL